MLFNLLPFKMSQQIKRILPNMFSTFFLSFIIDPRNAVNLWTTIEWHKFSFCFIAIHWPKSLIFFYQMRISVAEFHSLVLVCEVKFICFVHTNLKILLSFSCKIFFSVQLSQLFPTISFNNLCNTTTLFNINLNCGYAGISVHCHSLFINIYKYTYIYIDVNIFC